MKRERHLQKAISPPNLGTCLKYKYPSEMPSLLALYLCRLQRDLDIYHLDS